jgi:hypothetical protein
MATAIDEIEREGILAAGVRAYLCDGEEDGLERKLTQSSVLRVLLTLVVDVVSKAFGVSDRVGEVAVESFARGGRPSWSHLGGDPVL